MARVLNGGAGMAGSTHSALGVGHVLELSLSSSLSLFLINQSNAKLKLYSVIGNSKGLRKLYSEWTSDPKLIIMNPNHFYLSNDVFIPILFTLSFERILRVRQFCENHSTNISVLIHYV